MKILITLAIALLISGCSALFPPTFTDGEYSLFVEISVAANHTKQACTPDSALDTNAGLVARLRYLDLLTDRAVTYSKYLKDNAEVHEIAKILDNDIEEMKTRYNETGISLVYCQTKMDIFIAKTDRALKSIANLQE